MLDWGLWEVTALGFFMGYKAIKKKKKRKGEGGTRGGKYLR